MTDPIAIDIKGLTKSFSNGWLGKKQVLDDLNFQIRDNEVFGYLGGNGAGKTTTFKLMLDLIRPDKGDISFWGCSAKDRISRAMIGYLRAYMVWEKGTNRRQFFQGLLDKYTWVDIGFSFLPSDMTAAFLYAPLELTDPAITGTFCYYRRTNDTILHRNYLLRDWRIE